MGVSFIYILCYPFLRRKLRTAGAWKEAEMRKPALWTRNFTLITLGTVISAIGGTAMNLALSLVVFDQTDSTWLSGLFAAVSIVPSLVLPFLLAPMVDQLDRKKIIVTLDYTNAAAYLVFWGYLLGNDFSYLAYMAFSFLTSSIGAVYSLAYEALYPDLIPQGMSQKGYAVSSLIYPTVTALITPLASALYLAVGIRWIILGEGILLALAASFELLIRSPLSKPASQGHACLRQRLRTYRDDLAEGLRYIRRERGIRSIYLYMMTTNATGQGAQLMTLAHFQSSSILTTGMYSLLITAETIGRMVGGLLHYGVKIPPRRRYALTRTVYQAYEISDAILLFCPYPVMLILRFLCGFMGVNTATLRTAAVQNYLPRNMRARINGLFSVLVSLGMMVVQLLVGALGEVLPYRVVALLFAAFSFSMIFLLIVRNKPAVKPIYDLDC